MEIVNKDDRKKSESWILRNGIAYKQIDSTLVKYGETDIPTSLYGFFELNVLDDDYEKKVLLIWDSIEYESNLFMCKQNNEIKLQIRRELQIQLEQEYNYGEGFLLAFQKKDNDKYNVSINESDEDIFSSVYLDDETDLVTLKYNVEGPIFKAVNIQRADFSVFELHRKYNNKKLKLDVEFQRRDVWKPQQQMDLIESVLMGLPLPIIYFKQLENGQYVVIDGKQRLTALFKYMNDDYELDNLKILDFLNKKRFSQLTDKFGIYQTQLEDYTLRGYSIQPPTPDRIVFDIFERVNRNGTKLNKMEIRHALYGGDGLDCLELITKSKEFENVTGIKYEKDYRMKGLYLVTRAVSFSLLYSSKIQIKYSGTDLPVTYNFNGDIDELQGLSLTYLNKVNGSELRDLYNSFVAALNRAYSIAGDLIFRKGFEKNNPINMNMFETIMYLILELDKRGADVENKVLKKKLFSAVTSIDYLENIGNRKDSITRINKRYAVMNRIIDEVMLNDK